MGLIGVAEDGSRPALNPKKRKIEDVDDLILKKTKAKETVKREMKKVLENELETKEVHGPKQAKQMKKPAALKTETTPAVKPKEPIEDNSDNKQVSQPHELYSYVYCSENSCDESHFVKGRKDHLVETEDSRSENPKTSRSHGK